MFIGEVPATFYIELLIRVVAVYAILIISMRLMGKRMSSQLSRNELAALVSLAAAIGVPLQSPDRGLLPAVVIAVVIVGVSKGISFLIRRSEKLEQLSQGNYALLVEDGVLKFKEMEEVRISNERLFAQLREKSIRHLGEVKRLYMEAGDGFTLVRADPAQPGLSIIPEIDTDFLEKQETADDVLVCRKCGVRSPGKDSSGCQLHEWTEAIV